MNRLTTYLLAALLLMCAAWFVKRPAPAMPWDHAVLRGQVPDSLAFREGDPGVFCAYSRRGEVWHRVPAAAATMFTVDTDRKLRTEPIPMAGPHLCYLIEPNGPRT